MIAALIICMASGATVYAVVRLLDSLYRPQDEDYESQPPLDD
jgi:hypothetical protein